MAKINGSKENDTLNGGLENDVIKGNAGDDVITGGAGKDTITGGTGFNTIIHHEGDGNDVINLTKGEDFLLKVDANYGIELSANKKDVLVYTKEDHSEYITIKNLGSKDVTNDSSKKKPTDDSSVMVQVGENAAFELRDAIYSTAVYKNYTGTWLNENIDASDIETALDKKGIKGVSISAGNGNDTITGSKFNDTLVGGNGNDVIEGGIGADVITGGAGANTVVHHAGDGNDVINLTKGENLLLKVDNIYEIKIADNKKDVLVYTSETEYITIKNLAAKDVTNNATKKTEDTSSVLLQVAGQDTPIDLRNYKEDWYSAYFQATNKNYTGTWLGEYIYASDVIAGKNNKGISINAGGGNDFIEGSEFDDTLKGGDGDDYIWTMGGKDKVYGGNGNDYLISNAGDTLSAGTELEPSILYGEKGNDIIEIWNTGDVAYGGDGDDTIVVNNDNSKTVYGGKGNDEIRIGSGGATVYGEAGDDIIDGGNKTASTIVFAKGAGHDTYRNDGAADVLLFDKFATTDLSFEKNGNDLVINYGKNESVTVKNYADDMTVYVQTKDNGKVLLRDLYNTYINGYIGTSKADNIIGTNNSDLIYGFAGNDYIFANKGADTIYGFAGNDEIIAFGENSVVYGGDGNDDITLMSQNQKVAYGEKGNDYLSLEYGLATISGGVGNDTIEGGFINNSDIIFSKGDGNDLYQYRGGLYICDKVSGKKLNGDYDVNEETLVFEDSAITDLSFSQKGNNLVITYGKNSTVTVENYYKFLGATEPEQLEFVYRNGNIAHYITGSENWEIYIQTKDGDKFLLSEMLKSKYGTSNSDKITTDKEIVHSFAGNDIVTLIGKGQVVYAGEGNDTVYGGKGNDYIEGNAGADTIYGGDGNDEIHAAQMKNPALGYAYGNIVDDASVNKLDGGAGDDTIYSSLGADTIYGGKGNDSLEVFGTNSVTYAGDGDDEITLYYNSAKTVYGEKGNDYVSIEYGQVEVYGGEGNDFLESGLMNNSNLYFSKGDGNDLYRYRGALKYDRGQGDGKNVNEDTLVFQDLSFDELSFAQDGDNLVINYGENASVTIENYYKYLGAEGAELAFADERGNTGKYIVESGQWKIYIQTTEGKTLLADVIAQYNTKLQANAKEGDVVGTFANDTITLDSAAKVYGYAGNDTITGSDGNDTINGQAGDDSIIAGAGKNQVNAGAGNDYVVGGDDKDIIYGTDGNDTVYGGAGNDQIGNSASEAGDDLFYGGDGNDTVKGGVGKDTLYGDAGNDMIYGDGGDDYIYGGEGNDTIYGESNSNGTGTGNNYIDAGTGDDTVYGGLGNDTIILNEGKNTVYTYDGNDSIIGGAGNDNLYAGDGNNYVETGLGKNMVSCGTGNDTIIVDGSDNTVNAGAGDDSITIKGGTNYFLSAGAGNDTVVIEAGKQTLDLGDGDDTVTITNDWKLRDKESDIVAGKSTITGGAGNDTFNVGKGTFEVSLTGGEGADFFNISDTWHYDAYTYDGNGKLGVCKGSDITINDFSAEDTIALRNGAINHFLADGYKVSDTDYAKYSMFFDVALDSEGNATADLSKVMFALDDKDSVVSSYNATTGKLDTSIIIKTADENASVLDAGKIVFRDTEGNDVEYKFNEVFINDVTEKVAAWLSDNNYGSVSEAITAGDTEVLTAFVNASLPNATGPAGGYDIFVPVV